MRNRTETQIIDLISLLIFHERIIRTGRLRERGAYFNKVNNLYVDLMIYWSNNFFI